MTRNANAPLVLVGITTRNRASLLPKAIASALAQDHPNLEVAVIDDGSTDDTPLLKSRFPSVSWQRHETSLGIIESRNELMQKTNAAYYVSLDDDAWFLRSDEISLAVQYAEKYPQVAAIAFDILSPDRPGPVKREPARPVAIFIGCGHLLRISAVRDAGFYASTPGVYGSEEKDICLRLADRDLSVMLLPGVHVWHEKAWQNRDFFPIHRSGVCNELVMTLRRCPLPDLFVVLPLKLVSFFWFWIRRPSFFPAGLIGVADMFRHLPAALRTRAPIRRTTFWNFGKPPAR